MIAKIEILHQKAFCVAGIAIRTSNQNGQAQKDIGGLWSRFINEELCNHISGKVSDDIYCVYTDYETDHTGPYTAILGCRVNALIRLPNGFTGVTIPEGKYLEYLLAGKFPEKVTEAWQEIWNSDIDRKYTADYDLYSADAESFEKTESRIYLAVW
jgi:predicted transcriptional regulator YdeE